MQPYFVLPWARHAASKAHMTDSIQPKSRLQSVGAVLAGFFTIVVLSGGTDAVLHATGVFPPWGQPTSDGLLGLALIYRIVYSILSCYITARLAPNRPMRHALILGMFGFLVSMVGAVATWDRGPEFGPHWFPVALSLLAIPCAWLGAKLRERNAH
jgi:hypothetical protein